MLSERGIVEKLKLTDTYDEKVEGPIRVIETNVHWVFLTGHFAYKMKKKIKFGDVLDFSTLKLRKEACENEIKLNSRLAKDLYIGVVPFTNDGRINGEGEVIEYLIKMKELPQDLLLSNIIRNKNKLTKEIIEKIVNKIVEFHNRNIYQKEIDVYENIFEKWDENFRTTIDYKGFPFDKKFSDRVYGFLRNNREFWVNRLEEKRIIDGHGDLQTRNIFIKDDDIIIFDCIEFNESLRIQDILEEIAFLAMDLDNFGLKKESQYLIKKYAEQIGEKKENIKKMIPFYKSYRAYVRAKVHYSTFLYSYIEEEREVNYNLALQYLKLAKKYHF